MALDESKTDNDNVSEAFGITIVADQQFSQYLEGAVVDYVDSPNGGGFEIKTPYQSDCSSCGSGCSS